MAPWHLDVSILLPFLNLDGELQSRLVRRRFLEIVAAAPIVGVQSYLFDSDAITDAVGPHCLSLRGGKPEPIRNMRTSQLISSSGFLQEGGHSRYRIRAVDKGDHALSRISKHIADSEYSFYWTVSTWVAFGMLIEIAVASLAISWIGVSSLLGLTLGSIALRAVDRLILVPTGCKDPQHINGKSATFISDESTLILEGYEDDVSSWTRSSLRQRRGPSARRLKTSSHVIATLIILLALLTVLRGTAGDRLLMVMLYLLGHLNTFVSQRLHMSSLLKRLIPIEKR